ncbi:dihydrodipicolinate synthase family protein [Siculibacillus lacustris]|uniref:Dihydrodipicolinate synthase family protein n=1 Tax=Siculibacillus lacustris TaxID=1549641 RepID=A0A4Q9VJU0_9HYPH|nr:dihydrodipicolinate synthase family protein [Siculibacillus lacustris]TBW35362.1 dihydrodipicolinate synthase family protein [Siculibacillus lacustris]
MTDRKIDEGTRGVFIIAPTPFTDRGEVDDRSTDALVDFYLECGVTGMTILGVLGEAPKLAPSEAHAFLERVSKRVDGRIPIVVGASNPGTDNLIRFSRTAMDLGAAGLMIAPPPRLRTDDQVFAYWDEVLSRLGPDTPVCYQDYPQITDTVTSVSVLHRLIDRFANLVMLKHEESPGLGKITQLRQRSDRREGRRVSILCGNGGLHLPQELRRGADGAMTGYAYPEMLVRVCALFFAGETEAAEDLYDLHLPLLRHEQQLGFGLALRKEVLHRRGILASAVTRHPGPRLTARDHEELDQLLARLNRKLHATE